MSVWYQSLWTTILYHVTDVHEWATGACHHGPLPKNHTSVWIEEDSVAHATLISVIMNQMWLKDVEKFLPFRYRTVTNWYSRPLRTVTWTTFIYGQFILSEQLVYFSNTYAVGAVGLQIVYMEHSDCTQVLGESVLTFMDWSDNPRYCSRHRKYELA